MLAVGATSTMGFLLSPLGPVLKNDFTITVGFKLVCNAFKISFSLIKCRKLIEE